MRIAISHPSCERDSKMMMLAALVNKFVVQERDGLYLPQGHGGDVSFNMPLACGNETLIQRRANTSAENQPRQPIVSEGSFKQNVPVTRVWNKKYIIFPFQAIFEEIFVV